MSGVKTLHPAITTIRRSEWQLMRDCMDGEEAIKARGTEYLPMPSGFASQDDSGKAMYAAYANRAQFPEFLAPSVGAMIGIIHGQEWQVEMPTAMEYLYEDSDGNGLPLEAFSRRITRELLVIGSYAVLTDAPAGDGPGTGGNPWLRVYRRDKVLNWDSEWWVLDESTMSRDGFVWKQIERYLVLSVIGAGYVPTLLDENGNTIKQMQVRARGGGFLPRIPFVIGSAMDLSPRIEAPPLIGVARAAKAFYQLSADYRHQLYMSGQETLVAINGRGPDYIGAGVVHEMPGSDTMTPDLKYVSPTCAGIDAHDAAMTRQREAAVQAGARLFEQTAQGAESGEAKKLRYHSETATLTSVAQNSALLLERALKNAAMIMGLPEEDIVVTPPKDLMDRTMSPQDFAALFGVYSEGGMSWDTYFENGQRGGIFSNEITAEEENARLDAPSDAADEPV